jgi:hypothetical protein
MIVRLHAITRLLTLAAAVWILLVVVMSFVTKAIHIWMPPFIVWLLTGGFVAQLVLWLVIRVRRS